jgi:carboxymethylenebutenolidase
MSSQDRHVHMGREMVEELRARLISRRSLFKRLVLVCGGSAGASALLDSCGDEGGVPEPAGSGMEDGGSAGGSGGGTAVSADASEPPPPDAAPSNRPPSTLSVAADDPTIQASKVMYPGPAGPVTAYLARPRAAGDYPGVIVIHEGRGLDDHIRDVARRVAKANFIALAPDLTSRWGTTEMLDPDSASRYLSGADPAQLVADLDGGVTFLGTGMGVRPGDRWGVLGFGMGGGYALRLAATNPKIAACVAYYGPAPMPIEMMRNTVAAILGHYAETDDTANSSRGALERVLTQAGKIFMARVHPGTRDAFNNDTGASYNEGAAVSAWSDTTAWLEQFLEV